MQAAVPGVHTMDIQKTGQVPQLPAGVAGWVYRYRRNWNLFFLLSSCGWCDPGVCVAHSWLALALLDMRNVLAAPHSSYPTLSKPGHANPVHFYAPSKSVPTFPAASEMLGRAGLCDRVQHVPLTLALLSASVWAALGLLRCPLPSGLKRKGKPKSLKSRKGGHTCFSDRHFLKLVCIWVIMYFGMVGEMRNFTHGIWKSLWLTTLLDSNNVAVNFPPQKIYNCISCTRNNLSFSFKWMCCFESQLFNSFI